MKPFLQQVATLFYQHYGTEVRHLAFVFPNRRAGLFFRKYLSQAAGKPLFSPAILTIDGLFTQMSDKMPADHLRMLFLLYQIYSRQSGADERFDDFVFWGEMLLNDFDDVDKYLVDARRLFTNVTELHDIDRDFSYLNPGQIEAIRSFWSEFHPGGDSENRQRFLHIWKLLYAIYNEFRETLAAEGCGYEGMIFREVVERLAPDKHCGLPYRKIVFVGLNALSTAEIKLLQLLKNQDIADFYWDCGSKMLTDTHNLASLFVTAHLKRFPSELSLPPEKHNIPEIELIGVPSGIGQAKQVHTILKDMLGGRIMMDPEEALRTAIVLPDEQLLIPVLHSIPEEIEHINVTLGYPLSGTPVASLMESILLLRKNVRMTDGQPAFYHRDALFVLNHQYIRSACGKDVASLMKEIAAYNKVYVTSSDLSRNQLLSLIFSTIEDTDALSDYLIAVLQELNRAISVVRPGADDDETPVSMNDIEQEFIYHCFTAINRMKDLIRDAGISMTADTYFRLLKRVTDTITIPFRGEPLSGLQVMGVLETRVLDFDRLIILSMNEGVFPAKKTTDSFIPYNLRRGFGLPAYEHRDSIRAYHFYRMIARAKHVTLLYDTRTEGLQTGEVSRFVHQLRYHYNVPIRDNLVVYNISSSQPPALHADKTDEVMTRLSAYLSGGTKALSASAINTYLDCPLKFYFTFVENMGEDDEVVEAVENRIFGNILHKVLEMLYQPLCNTLITADLLKLASKESALTELIGRAFAELYFHTDKVQPLSGQHFLTGEMIRKYVLKILEQDRLMTPFRYIGSEKKMQEVFRLSDNREVRLKGFIDRMDEVNGTQRIVDYKTGIKKSLEYKTVAHLFDRAAAERPQAVMQVFMYAWMYGACPPQPVQPVIYYVRGLFSPTFDPVIYEGKEKTPVEDFAPLRDPFESHLRTCLDEILNADVPFMQTAHKKTCAYCAFTGICGKDEG
ncbi:MAG: PD-(D/E)XK nuclease family protein [Tannerella sp.]|jgi:RecB family exonuclease|nr:PD-(D/E)XK nuclease family protein [Tannerella sp.]